jgi:quercetin dioxygenase-like cupin family protein
MDISIRNIEQEITARQGFQRDTEEVFAEVHFKAIQRHRDTNMNLVIIAGGQNGLQAPHYHKDGFDFFVVLHGQGWLHTADLVDETIGASGWKQKRVSSGDAYAVEPHQIHCLLNDGTEELVFLNVSPAAHMDADYFAIEATDLEALRRA